MSEKYEMGWNDVLANIRRAKNATVEQKDAWLHQIIDGQINLPCSDSEYKRGTVEAAQSILDRDVMKFMGPPEVIEFLELACSNS